MGRKPLSGAKWKAEVWQSGMLACLAMCPIIKSSAQPQPLWPSHCKAAHAPWLPQWHGAYSLWHISLLRSWRSELQKLPALRESSEPALQREVSVRALQSRFPLVRRFCSMACARSSLEIALCKDGMPSACQDSRAACQHPLGYSSPSSWFEEPRATRHGSE